MSAPAPLKLAILISGRGSNMTAILRAAFAGEIAVQPAIVIADRSGAAGLASAAELGVPTADWPGQTHRETFEQMLTRTLETVQPDAIALAGFMRLLSSDELAYHIEGTYTTSVLPLEHIGLFMWTAHYTLHE